ncbi:MAG: DUF4417 domain-containing protein [Solobacterium sp.]|nr:DUF4417 domain-containing protein [Solobacterium sp.]
MKQCILQKPSDIKDVFGAFLVKNATFTHGKFDMPVVKSNIDSIPAAVLSYHKVGKKKLDLLPGTALHFYNYDYIFDGKYGVWNSLINGVSFARGFNLEKIQDFDCVIVPDYSLYTDMPIAWQIWNVYRSRVVAHALQNLGYKVIINARWADSASYEFCFEGISVGSIVAVSSYGCAKSFDDRKLFDLGLEEMIKRIHPETIIFYGSVTDTTKLILTQRMQKYVVFESDMSISMKGVSNHGDEG